MLVSGELFVFVAFDWGDGIDLEHARQLVPSSLLALARRRRTPSSFSYRPAPLHVALDPLPLQLAELGAVQATAAATSFDFGAVSLSLRIPFQLERPALLRLASSLADPAPLVEAVCRALRPLYQQMLPAIQDPVWDESFREEYFVFRLPPEEIAVEPSAWLAGLVLLDDVPLGPDEIAEASRLRLRYSPDDLFVPDWSAAVLIDRDCDETLQVIEFANLQLLEFRHIDSRLDDSLHQASRHLYPTARAFSLWRRPLRPLRALGELRVEATGLFERASNVLKLVGDAYLARVYRLVATRFHLETWQENIQRKLDVTEGVYQVASDQASTFRAEFLETVVVLLILIEVIVAFVRH